MFGASCSALLSHAGRVRRYSLWRRGSLIPRHVLAGGERYRSSRLVESPPADVNIGLLPLLRFLSLNMQKKQTFSNVCLTIDSDAVFVCLVPAKLHDWYN